MGNSSTGTGDGKHLEEVGAYLGKPLEREIGQLGSEQELEQMAWETGALIRHRGVQSAQDLLRVILGYSMLDYSFRQLGMWAVIIEIAELSKTAWLQRLRHCRQWLGRLVLLALLQQHVQLPADRGIRVKLVDATVICQPGSKGTDWRLHLGFDLGAMCLDQIELTDGRGAERLDRFDIRAGEVWIGDRAYAIAKSLGYLLFRGAWVVVRTGWNRLALETEDGQCFDLVGWLRQQILSPLGSASEQVVWINTPQGRYALRLVAQALSPQAVEKARRKVREDARKNHHTPDERSLYTAGFILLLTNLPESYGNSTLILQLYRFRWQIECAFKRMKSLIHLDHLRAKDPQLAQVYLFGKLLGVLLVEGIQRQLFSQHPDWFLDDHRPMSYWRLSSLLWNEMCLLIRGPLALAKIIELFPKLLRYLLDEPRHRKQQLVQARILFQELSFQ